MKHVVKIRMMLEHGEYSNAQKAIEHLLSLGPSNIEALKLKCALMAHEGRFEQEAKIWEKIIDIDSEDLDALFYFQRRHFEDRESFYFTDHLPEGGRRFFAHPRNLIDASILGLFGCTFFLLLNAYTQQHYLLNSSHVALASFSIFVILPWSYIIQCYLKSLREVLLTNEGICFNTRVRSAKHEWSEFKDVYLANELSSGETRLQLVFIPKDTSQPYLEIDLSKDSTSIRARNFFIYEISRLFQAPLYAEQGQIMDSTRSKLSY